MLPKIIFRTKGLDISGRTLEREAVRAVIIKGSQIFLILAEVTGEYKFPGGGVEINESLEDALRREVREETGAEITRIEQLFGTIIEYDAAFDPDQDIFKMTSYYYVCQIASELGSQHLDEYEADLGFVPVWIDLRSAIETNIRVLNGNQTDKPKWTRRELYVLEQVENWLEQKRRV